MGIQDVVSELESLGAVGNGGNGDVHSKPTLPSPPPTSRDVSEGSDERSAAMVDLTRRAVRFMDTIIEDQIALRELFVEIHDLWAEPLAGEDEETETSSVETALESGPDAALEIENDEADSDVKAEPIVEVAKPKARETGNAILDILAQEESNGYRLDEESDDQ